MHKPYSIVAVLAATACGEPVETVPVEVFGLSPPAVCADLDGSEVRVLGTGLEPILGDLLTARPEFEVSDVELRRAGGLDGSADGVEAPDVFRSAFEGQVRYDDGGLIVSLGSGLGLVDGSWDVTVIHPVEGDAELAPGLAVVPPAEISRVVPVSVGREVVTVSVEGTGLLDIDGALPTVQIGPRVYRAVSATGCTGLAVSGVSRCAQIQVELDGGDLAVGVHEVTVVNAAPAECRGTSAATLQIAGE